MLRVLLVSLIVLAWQSVHAQTSTPTPTPVDQQLGCDPAPVFPVADLGEPQNIDIVKAQLLYYRCTTYDGDVARVLDAAQKWVVARAPQVVAPLKPAIVLDIDETSLSNWPRIYLDDFAFIPNGSCTLEAGDPCGDTQWQRSGAAQALQPTLKLYKAARCIDAPSPCTPIEVFFVTGRRERARDWTARNLKLAGYGDVDREHLYMREPDAPDGASAYKTSKRMDIESRNFLIIANVGDQRSDLAGGHAEMTFKVPNPFYFIP